MRPVVSPASPDFLCHRLSPVPLSVVGAHMQWKMSMMAKEFITGISDRPSAVMICGQTTRIGATLRSAAVCDDHAPAP